MPYAYSGDYSGDPGLFSSIGSALGKIGSGIVKAVIPQPARAVANVVTRAITGAPSTQLPRITPSVPGLPFGPSMPFPRTSAGTTNAQRAAAGLPPKRRRMNPTNAKALRRAIRRQDGFVKLARRALKGTGYRIVTAGSQRKRVSVRESGAGSVTVH